MRMLVATLFLLGAPALAHADVHRRGPRLSYEESSARAGLARADRGVGECMQGVPGRFDVVATQIVLRDESPRGVTWLVRVRGAPERRGCVERALQSARIADLSGHAGVWWSSEPGPDATRLEIDGLRQIEVLGPTSEVWARFLTLRVTALARCLPPVMDPQTILFDASRTETQVLWMRQPTFEACVAHAIGAGRPRGWARVWIRVRQQRGDGRR